MKQVLPPDWLNWLQENLQRGCALAELIDILRKNQFSEIAIKQALVSAKGQKKPTITLHKQLQAVSNVLDASLAERLSAQNLQLYCQDQFLAKNDCAHLIELIKRNSHPSQLASETSDTAFRTSRTCDLGILDDAVVAKVDQKISRFLGLPTGYGEVMQGQHYRVGEEFKAHTDYFDADELIYHGGQMGQRTFTVMIYLNDVIDGGETYFVHSKLALKPVQGRALIWNNLTLDGALNGASLHQGKPVLCGEKFIITKWFRTRTSA
ncbi:prolyl hydroxylase family protein [Gayadomonas joobiniege]|uniref:prolyl hydroxylase family protein n=1 Tax=Gayadomonas joobiniege TaxID=1234606 RepID=UPI00035F1091|nr:2OG-Fe(II) oxygenase [Gayadomonas joobiniege]